MPSTVNTQVESKKYNTRSSRTAAAAANNNTTKAADATKTATTKKHAAAQKYKRYASDDDDDEEYICDTCSEDDDDDDDEDDYDDDDDDDDDVDADDALAMAEYQNFLSELFPSKYMSKRAAATKAAAGLTTPVKPQPRILCPGAPKKKRKLEAEEAEMDMLLASEEDDDDDTEMSDAENDDDEHKPLKYNISFVINQDNGSIGEYHTAAEALYDEDCSEMDEEEDEEEDEEDEDEEMEEPKKKEPSASTKPAAAAAAAQSEIANAFQKMKSLFGNLTAEDQLNPTIKKTMDEIVEKEKRFLKKHEALTKKQKTTNTKKLKALLKERDVMNDLQYFNEKMTIEEQERALAQIEVIKEHSTITKPYRLTLLDADIPPQYKAIAYRKISTLRYMEPGGGEYYKMKNWVDAFMQIPFGKYKNLPITMDDGVEKCHAFMDNAKQILDQAVYGLNDAKLQIMQMIGQWIVNPGAIGTAIAIKGPMGTGKTTLVKDGISKILGRDFAFIALGGATDSSFLEGHSYTYEGSMWGKIVDLLIKCKSMNPVIYFDELDKISDTPKGEEIAGILTHLTDTTQNSQFHDRYFSDIDFDLSRCLFIFSYNDESKVNRILLDRMYRIQTKGYDQPQKTTIANNYLLPKICEQVRFNMGDINIPEATMHYIITNYTDKEDGVRTLKRCLEIVYTKLNLYRLMRPETNIFENEMSIKVEFPMQVTPEIVDKLIKKNGDSGSWQNMYM